MFEKYSNKARRAVFFARYEASQMGVAVIDTEHLLLGVLREEQSILSRFFPAQASLKTIRRRIQRRVLFRRRVPASVELPLSIQAKQVLRRAAQEADSWSHSEVKPEHFLLGLLQENNSLCARLLQEHKVAYAEVRQAVEHDVKR